jgi:hypothetical protein
VPIDLALVLDPGHARGTVTMTERAVTTAARRMAFVLEARALLIASVQSLGVLRIATPVKIDMIVLITDMTVVGTMITTTSAPSLKAMDRQ